MVKEGTVVKIKPGRYDLKASVANYINTLKESIDKKDVNAEKVKLSKELEGLKHEKLKARKTELQVLALEKKMHMAEDVEYLWNSMIAAAKGRINAIPTKCAPMVAGIEQTREIQAILKREIDDVLNQLADYDIDMFDSEYDDVIDEE